MSKKLKVVTPEELDAVVSAGLDCCNALHDITHRIERGYISADLPAATRRACELMVLVRAASDLSVRLLSTVCLQEELRDIEKKATHSPSS